jgi:5'-3' exonuclease
MQNKFSLIDVSNIVYQVYFRNYKWFNPNQHTEKALVPFLLNKINELIAPAVQQDFVPIYLYDKKKNSKYWRQNFIEDNAKFYSELWADPTTGRGMNTGSEPNQEQYKGGRLTPDKYNPVLNYTRKAAELLKTQPGYWFEEPGLEADDFTGLLVKYAPANYHLDLVSVDKDWCGLLKLDNPNIRFIDMYPKRRYEIHYAEDVVKYFQAKLHSSIEKPEEAYYWKQQLGETGDNLLPGCHIELIDLINHCAPETYGFAAVHKQIIDFWTSRYTNTDIKKDLN